MALKGGNRKATLTPNITCCSGYVITPTPRSGPLLKLKQRVDNHKLEIVKNIYRDQRYATRSGRYAVAAMDRSRHCFLGEGSILGHHRSMA